MPELVAAAPEEMLQAVGYYGPAGPAPAAFARLSAGLDETVVRVITARPGLDPVRRGHERADPGPDQGRGRGQVITALIPVTGGISSGRR